MKSCYPTNARNEDLSIAPSEMQAHPTEPTSIPEPTNSSTLNSMFSHAKQTAGSKLSSGAVTEKVTTLEQSTPDSNITTVGSPSDASTNDDESDQESDRDSGRSQSWTPAAMRCPFRCKVRHAHSVSAPRPTSSQGKSRDFLFLVTNLLELLGISGVQGNSLKLLVDAVKLQRLCSYSVEDIAATLAHTSVYFEDVQRQVGHSLPPNEASHILVTLMYIAHCHVHDETCRLNVWHERLFTNYCSLPTLNKAVVRLLEMRGWLLRVDNSDMMARYSHLLGECTGHGEDYEESDV